MSEYRFTGPFYNDNDESLYYHNYENEQGEPVTPPPVQPKATEEIPEEPAESAAEEAVEEEKITPPPVEPTPPPTWEPTPKEPKPQKKNDKFGKKLLKAAAFALVIGAVAGGAFLGVVSAGFQLFGIGKVEQTITEVHKAQSGEGKEYNIKDSIDVTHIAETCMPSVVSITNKGVQEIRSWFGTYQQETSGSGSGIIIGENNTELLIVTNYHVVADSTELSVYFSFDEKEKEQNVVSAKMKGYDSQKDLAVISVKLSDIPVEAKEKIAIATVGDSSQLKVGEQVVAIGNALGYGQSVTTGIVSALDREVSVSGSNGEVITNKLIQTDAAINPGNSGGALINMRGEVIGINSVKLASQEVEGMGYAIPITAVGEIIGDLMNKETRDKVPAEKAGYLGIECISVTSEAAQMYDMPVGVYVKNVVEGSAAEKAGLKAGDVIIKLDGSSIASDQELIEALGYYESGETVEIVVKTRDSGYQEQSFEVTLGSRAAAGLD